MARTTPTKTVSAPSKTATARKSPPAAKEKMPMPADSIGNGEAADRYVVPLVHVAMPGTWVHFGATRRQARADRYVVPLVHVGVPAHWVDYGIWAAVGSTVVSGGLTFPMVAGLGTAVAVIRHRSQKESHPAPNAG
jgi:hypothetical protein